MNVQPELKELNSDIFSRTCENKNLQFVRYSVVDFYDLQTKLMKINNSKLLSDLNSKNLFHSIFHEISLNTLSVYEIVVNPDNEIEKENVSYDDLKGGEPYIRILYRKENISSYFLNIYHAKNNAYDEFKKKYEESLTMIRDFCALMNCIYSKNMSSNTQIKCMLEYNAKMASIERLSNQLDSERKDMIVLTERFNSTQKLEDSDNIL